MQLMALGENAKRSILFFNDGEGAHFPASAPAFLLIFNHFTNIERETNCWSPCFSISLSMFGPGPQPRSVQSVIYTDRSILSVLRLFNFYSDRSDSEPNKVFL